MCRFAGLSIVLLGVGLGDASQQAAMSEIQSLATGGMESRSATLVAFQKYAEEMIRAHSGKQTPVSAAIRDAVNVILQYVDQMYDELLSYHGLDEADAQCPEANACLTDHMGSDAQTTMQTHINTTTKSRSDHADCRDALKSHCQNYPFSASLKSEWNWHTGHDGPIVNALLQESSQVSSGTASSSAHSAHCDSQFCRQMIDEGLDYCEIYDAHRKAISDIKQECEGNFLNDLNDAHIAADEDSETGRSKLSTMEECLVETEAYIEPLYQKYMMCQCRRCQCEELPETCRSKQSDFESQVCQKEGYRVDTCNAYFNCWNTHWNKCQPGGEVCQRIQTNVIGRTADNETGERIRCLLKVLNSTDGPRADGLAACTGKDYTAMNDFWAISCPDGLACMPELPIDCNQAYEIPCTNDFLQAEYRSIGLNAGFDVHASNYENQVGQCQACSVEPQIEQVCEAVR